MLLVPAHYSPRKQDFLALQNPQQAGYDPAQNRFATQVTPSALANTKGAYVELLAATTNQTRWIEVQLSGEDDLLGKSWLVDIAIGPAGLETVIVPNLVCNPNRLYGLASPIYRLPISIPLGTRIAARCQATAAGSNTIHVKATVYDGALTQITGAIGIDAIGVNLATSLGTAIAPGTPPTPSAYVQLVAAAAHYYKMFMVSIDFQDTATNYSWAAVDVAIGGAGSEVVIVPDLVADMSAPTQLASGPYPIYIPAGTRIAARAQETGTKTNIGVAMWAAY